MAAVCAQFTLYSSSEVMHVLPLSCPSQGQLAVLDVGEVRGGWAGS